MQIHRRRGRSLWWLSLTLVLIWPAVGQTPMTAAAPTWTPTVNPMSYARYVHAASTLPDGRVLVTGGSNGTSPTSGADIFDPATNRWAPAASMSVARLYHVSIVLADGRILVAGGYSGSGYSNVAEIYDAGTNSWAPAAPMLAARGEPAAVRLQDGRVLVIGGSDAPPEIFDPRTGSWTFAAHPPFPQRWGSVLVLLPNERVLWVGGYRSDFDPRAAIYDPASDGWAPAGNMSAGRGHFTATQLPDGRVVVAGGHNYGTALANVDIFDPDTGTWARAADMPSPKYAAAAALRRDGRVLVAGGYGTSGVVGSAALYDPGSNSWEAADPMSMNRYLPTATPIPGGRVLLAGGHSGSQPLASAEIYGAPNNPPTAVAQPVPTAPGCVSCLSLVTLNGAGSSDPDGDALTYTWRQGGTVLGTSRDPVTTATVQLRLGVHEIELTVTDGAGGAATAPVTVEVTDQSAPSTCEADLAAALRAIADRDGQITQLQGQLTTANQTIADQASQLAALRDENARLTAENAGLAAQNARLIAENAELRAQLEAALQALVERDRRIAQLEAQMTQLQGRNARLEAENAQLAAHVAQLQAELARLTAEHDALRAALDAALRAVQTDLQLTFADPAFVLPGATAPDRLRNLVNALAALERGRKMGVYTNLGGRPGR